MTEDIEKITLRSVISLLLMRWRLFALATAVFAIGTLVYAHYIPLEYTGTTIFERRLDIAAEQTSIRGSESYDARKLTLQYELAGLAATAEAVEQLGLTRGLPRDENGEFTSEGQRAKQDITERLMQQISIQWKVSSGHIDLVSVSFTDADPWLAEYMPNTLVENYINRVSKKSVESLSESRGFLENQVKICDNRFTELMRQRIDFEIKNAGVLPDSPASLHEGMIRLTTDLDTLRFQHAVAKQQLVRFEGLRSGDVGPEEDPNTGTRKPIQVYYGANPEYTRLQDELRRTKEMLVEVLDFKTEKHPNVELLRQKIARLEQQLEGTDPEAIVQTVYGTDEEDTELTINILSRQTQVDMADKEMERLQSRLESHQELLANFGPVRREYLEIIANIDDQQAELDKWESQQMKVHMALAAEVAKRRTHLNAVQPALKQFRPSSPSFWRVFMFAVVGSLAFGSGMVVLANRLDRSVMTPEQASRNFNFPIYGFVDVIMTPRQSILRHLKRWVLTPVLCLVLGVVMVLSCYSLSLRLGSPDRYEQWQASPVPFLLKQVEQAG